MSDQTPFEKWWEKHVPACFENEIVKRLAREAWIAALEFAAELMREEEKSE